MTIQDVIDLLLDESRSATPREIAITRAVLLAYELGMAAGITAARICAADEIVMQINAKEAASLEALRREAEEDV